MKWEEYCYMKSLINSYRTQEKTNSITMKSSLALSHLFPDLFQGYLHCLMSLGVHINILIFIPVLCFRLKTKQNNNKNPRYTYEIHLITHTISVKPRKHVTHYSLYKFYKFRDVDKLIYKVF